MLIPFGYAFTGYDIFSRMIIFKNGGLIEGGIKVVATPNMERVTSYASGEVGRPCKATRPGSRLTQVGGPPRSQSAGLSATDVLAVGL